jgi:hypothetical protein
MPYPLTCWIWLKKNAELHFWIFKGFQYRVQRFIYQQYRAWLEEMSLQVGLAPYWWQGLVYFLSSRRILLTSVEACTFFHWFLHFSFMIVYKSVCRDEKDILKCISTTLVFYHSSTLPSIYQNTVLSVLLQHYFYSHFQQAKCYYHSILTLKSLWKQKIPTRFLYKNTCLAVLYPVLS